VTTENRQFDDGFNGHDQTIGKVVLQLPASSNRAVSSK
jgi:hypothetical protein